MIAYTDALTDVKNKNAYTEIKAGYEKQINERTLKELGVIAFDLFNKQIEYNLRNGGAVIAGGMDIYSPDKDNCFDEIFERADIKMYNRKKQLKNVKVV